MKNLKKFLAMALAIASVITMTPHIAEAASHTGLNISSGHSHIENAYGKFTVTDEILNDLNYGLVVSIPYDFELAYDSEKKEYSGSDVLTCYGITGGSSSVKVEIDEESSTYGTIYDEKWNAYKLHSWTPYAVSLTKNVWTPEELKSNYESYADTMSYDGLENAILSITVPGKGFTPRSTGDYRAYVPIKISKE